VLEARRDVPDHRPCEDALSRIGSEPAGTGRPVDLGPSKRRLVAAWWPASATNASSSGCSRPARRPARAPVRLRHGTDAGRCAVEFREQRAPDPRRHHGHAGRTGRAAPGADRLFERRARHPGGRGHLSGDPRRASRRWSARPARSEARRWPTMPSSTRPTCCGTFRAPPARPATAAASRACAPARAGRGWPAIRCRASCALLAGTFPRPERISSILTVELRQAGPHRCAQRQPGDLLRPGDPGSTLVGYLNADHWALAVPIARRTTPSARCS
jgi:hypothetical protein